MTLSPQTRWDTFLAAMSGGTRHWDLKHRKHLSLPHTNSKPQLTSTIRAGSYDSTINDLIKFGDAVLKHKYLSAAETRKWFKPATETSSSGQSIGQPWEIFRAQNVTVDGRLIDFYTKGGDIKAYHSIIAFIPDYDLVAVILLSGAATSGFDVLLTFSQLAQALLPGIEQAGKSESETAYTGTYTDRKTNSTITLYLDDSPGFNVSPWIVRGVDVLRTSQGLDLPPIPFPPPPIDAPARFRLYLMKAASETRSRGAQSRRWEQLSKWLISRRRLSGRWQFVLPGVGWTGSCICCSRRIISCLPSRMGRRPRWSWLGMVLCCRGRLDGTTFRAVDK